MVGRQPWICEVGGHGLTAGGRDSPTAAFHGSVARTPVSTITIPPVTMR